MKIYTVMNIGKEAKALQPAQTKRWDNLRDLLQAYAISNPDWTSMIITVVKDVKDN